ANSRNVPFELYTATPPTNGSRSIGISGSETGWPTSVAVPSGEILKQWIWVAVPGSDGELTATKTWSPNFAKAEIVVAQFVAMIVFLMTWVPVLIRTTRPSDVASISCSPSFD